MDLNPHFSCFSSCAVCSFCLLGGHTQGAIEGEDVGGMEKGFIELTN